MINDAELNALDRSDSLAPHDRAVVIGGKHRSQQAPPKVTRVMMGIAKGDT